MAGKYLGSEPIKLKDGRTIKQNDIIESMSVEEAEARIGFEPVITKSEQSKKYTKKDIENE